MLVKRYIQTMLVKRYIQTMLVKRYIRVIHMYFVCCTCLVACILCRLLAAVNGNYFPSKRS